MSWTGQVVLHVHCHETQLAGLFRAPCICFLAIPFFLCGVFGFSPPLLAIGSPIMGLRSLFLLLW